MKEQTKIRLNSVDAVITKMRESSGNEQFFVRLVRNDIPNDEFMIGSTLDYSCWQTKNLPKSNCMKRAWFDVSFIARWAGLESMDDVKLVGLTEDEKLEIRKYPHLLH